jgi:hypothetical protein
MRKQKEKLYLVKKYVRASGAAQAIKREKEIPVHAVYPIATRKEKLEDAIGFDYEPPEESDDESVWED